MAFVLSTDLDSAARRDTPARRWPRPCVALLAAALALATGRDASAQGVQPVVSAVEIECDAWVDKKGLVRSLPLTVGEPLAEDALAVSRRRLEDTGIFRSVDVETRAGEDGVLVLIRLRREPMISRVSVQGYDGVQLKELRWLLGQISGGRLGGWREHELTRVDMRRLVQMRAGMLFEPEMLEQAERRILERFDKLGFLYSQVRSRVREQPGEVEISLQVDPGEAIVVEDVTLEGGECLPGEEWKPAVASFIGAPRSRDVVRRVRVALLRYMREQRYYDARVKASWQRRGDLRGVVRVEAVCGRLHEIAVTGNENVAEKDLLGVVDLDERLIISDNTWRLMARRMLDLYQGKGYYEADVTLKIGEDPTVKNVEFTVVEGGVYRLREILFAGNEAVTKDELRAEMETREARLLPWPRRGAVVAETLDEDTARIEALYHSRGFASATAKGEVVERGRDDLKLVVTIAEGPRTVLRSVEPTDFPAPVHAAKPLASVIGEPLDPAGLESDRDTVAAAWRALGYRDVNIEFDVERQENADEVAAALRWKVETGPRYVVGPISVRESVEVRNDLLLSEMPFASGDPLRTADLLQGQENIYSLGLFRTATVEDVEVVDKPERPGGTADADESEGARSAAASAAAEAAEETGEESERERSPSGAPDGGDSAGEGAPQDIVAPVAISVAARAPGRLSYGFGYNTRDGFTAFSEISYDNLWHRARSVRLLGELSLEPPTFRPEQFLASLAYVDRRFLNSPWEIRLSLLGERNTRTVNEFSIELGALGASLTRDLFENVRVGADLQVEYANVFDVDPVPFRARDEENSYSTALGGFVAYDRRNDAFNPTSGFIDSLRVRYAPPGISNVDFVEVDVDHSQFIPLGDYAGLAISLRAGWVRTFDNPIVPIRRRYFVGGGESVRGFAVNSLGPYDGDSNDVGGDLALVAKTELRVPVAWGFGLVFFVDGGSNSLLRCDSNCRAGNPAEPATRVRDATLSLDNFRRSAGVGLRYVSPVGPISVDYGIKLDRRRRDLDGGQTERESFGEFSISIGARF